MNGVRITIVDMARQAREAAKQAGAYCRPAERFKAHGACRRLAGAIGALVGAALGAKHVRQTQESREQTAPQRINATLPRRYETSKLLSRHSTSASRFANTNRSFTSLDPIK